MNAPTAIALVTDPAPRQVASLAGGPVAAIVPQTFDDVYRFAQVLAKSGLVPYGMDTPEKVSVAILTGLEIGVKPMQAVQGIAVINGVPRIWGDLALAIVRGSGQLEEFSEKLIGIEPENWPAPKGDELKFKAVCTVKRKGEKEVVKEYAISDAIVAKLWNKTGSRGPTPWVTNPKRMLAMRARAFALRDAFTDILKGMPIAEEMIGDEEPVYSNEPPPAPPPVPQEITNAAETLPPATDAGASVPSGASASNPDPAEDEPFDNTEVLSEIETNCSTIQTQSDMEEVRALFAEDLDKLTRSERETADYHFEQAQARLDRQAGTAVQQEASAGDPFTIPETFADARTYAEFIHRMVASAYTLEHADLMTRAWDVTKEARVGLSIDRATMKELLGALQQKIDTIDQVRPEHEPEVDLSAAATTVQQYAAQAELRAAETTDSERATALRTWWIDTTNLRDDLKIPSAERERIKKVVFSKIDQFRTAQG